LKLNAKLNVQKIFDLTSRYSCSTGPRLSITFT